MEGEGTANGQGAALHTRRANPDHRAVGSLSRICIPLRSLHSGPGVRQAAVAQGQATTNACSGHRAALLSTCTSSVGTSRKLGLHEACGASSTVGWEHCSVVATPCPSMNWLGVEGYACLQATQSS